MILEEHDKPIRALTTHLHSESPPSLNIVCEAKYKNKEVALKTVEKYKVIQERERGEVEREGVRGRERERERKRERERERERERDRERCRRERELMRHLLHLVISLKLTLYHTVYFS